MKFAFLSLAFWSSALLADPTSIVINNYCSWSTEQGKSITYTCDGNATPVNTAEFKQTPGSCTSAAVVKFGEWDLVSVVGTDYSTCSGTLNVEIHDASGESCEAPQERIICVTQ